MARRVPTLPRKKPLQRRAQVTVDAIIDAAAHILVKDGYDALSTNRVAERAGVSIGSLYQYFPNREALVRELIDRTSEMLFQMVIDALEALGDGDPRSTIQAIVRAMIEKKRESPRLYKVLREQIPRSGGLVRYEQFLAQIVVRSQEFVERHRSKLRVEDTATASFVVVHMVDALTHVAITQRDAEEDEAMIASITDAASRYLLRD